MSNSISLDTSTIRCIDGLYSLNDLHKASGGAEKHRPTFFLRLDQTQALIAEISRADVHTLKTVVGKGKEQGTYACRELVIAYAAWISPAFHLKVIRVFLDSTKAPAIDAGALLLENHSELTVTLPAELLDAIDKKAWEMTGEAYHLFREYLTRHIASYQYGAQGQEKIYVGSALEAIKKTTIGNALAHKFHSEIEGIERAVSFALYKAENALREIRGAKSGQDICHE